MEWLRRAAAHVAGAQSGHAAWILLHSWKHSAHGSLRARPRGARLLVGVLQLRFRDVDVSDTWTPVLSEVCETAANEVSQVLNHGQRRRQTGAPHWLFESAGRTLRVCDIRNCPHATSTLI